MPTKKKKSENVDAPEERKRPEIEEQFRADSPAEGEEETEVEKDASMEGRYAGQKVIQDDRPHSSGRVLRTDMPEGVAGAWSQSLEGDDAADIKAQEDEYQEQSS